jgi:hypothetical protein
VLGEKKEKLTTAQIKHPSQKYLATHFYYQLVCGDVKVPVIQNKNLKIGTGIQKLMAGAGNK